MTGADECADLRLLRPKEEDVRSALAQGPGYGIGALPRVSRLEARLQPQEVGPSDQGTSNA